MRTGLDFKTTITEWITHFEKRKKLSGEEEELLFLFKDLMEYILLTEKDQEDWKHQFIDLRAQLRELQKEMAK